MKKFFYFLNSILWVGVLMTACKTTAPSTTQESELQATIEATEPSVETIVQHRVSILGDSYSTFKGYVQPDTNLVWYPHEKQKNDVVQVEQTWWHMLLDSMDWKLEVNNSYSGATVCNTGYRQEDYSDRSFITRMDKLGQPTLIFVFGATNDSWAKSPIGDYVYADWKEAELYSFRPAMAKMFSGLKSMYPQAEIYFILNTGLKQEVNETVDVMCERYGVQCIKLHDIDKQYGHPSAAGMRAIASQVKEFFMQK